MVRLSVVGAFAVVLVVALPACTDRSDRSRSAAAPSATAASLTAAPSPVPTSPPSPPASPVATPTVAATASPGTSCPATYREADPDRPVVTLTFVLGESRESVTGTETMVFTPDLPISEIVFRLWPNGPQTAPDGARLRVTGIRVDGRITQGRVTPGGGALTRDGTVLRIPLAGERPAGATITIDLVFELRLPGLIADRLGHSPRTAWWASAHPMLAWERGHGWRVEAAPVTPGEGQVSEDFEMRSLKVTVPTGDEVLATGEPVGTGERPDGRKMHEFKAGAVRDVAVVSGDLALVEGEAAGVPVVVGLSSDGVGLGGSSSVAEVASLAKRSVEDMTTRFGPFPYERVSLVLLPGLTGGIEYPGMILLGGQQNRVVVPHEVGHEWFYGLVGDDQARDPWLDEAFATYAEALFNRSDSYIGVHEATGAPGRVGAPMSFWDEQPRTAYQRSVYLQGAGALLSARQRAGASKFDAAVRCYVAANAHRIARPADVRAALSHLPEAVQELDSAGAFTR